MSDQQPYRRSIADIIRVVCGRYRCDVDALMSSKKDRTLARARAFYATMGRASGYSYPQLGAGIGKHHTTILLAHRRALARTADAVAEVLQ